MTNTTYYNLKKPEDSDNVLISDLNGNADAIDQALHGLNEGLKGLKYEPPLTQAGSKSAVVDGDSMVITDSADGNKTKRVLWSAVKSALSAIFADKTHKHSAADITSGTLSSARLPTVPLTKGGTGATSAASARANLGALTSFSPVSLSIPLSWSGSGPYTQTVSVSGVQSGWDWRLALHPARISDNDARKLNEIAFACITDCETTSGGIKLTCAEKKPEVIIRAVLSGEV